MGLSVAYGILSSSEDTEIVGETGSFEEAAVDGLRSWAGEGWRLIEADWMVDAISMTAESMADIQL